jgi:hypothetical protein
LARRPSAAGTFSFANVPPGVYGVRVHPAAVVTGRLDARIGRDARPFASLPASGGTLHLPAGARLLTLSADAEARASLGTLTLEARGLTDTHLPLALSVARYGTVAAHVTDGNAFVEPTGLWVRAGRESVVVFAVESDRQAMPLLVRNGAIANKVRLAAGPWRMDLSLSPGEERVVDVPSPPGSDAIRMAIGSERGFRPTDHNPRSRDLRQLGVWIAPR